ncbi:MAG TPA: ABC transporter permease [Verrucomicrobiae bacterium]
MPASSPNASAIERVIRPRSGLAAIDMAELWRYRELFWQLAWRNVLIRYKQTLLGVAWAVLQPLLTVAIGAVVFGRLANLPSNGVPYVLLTFAALLPWQYFSNAMTESSNSLIASQNMITKVYFPRLIIPGSAVMSGMIDFLISLVLLFLLMLYHQTALTPRLLLLPFFFLYTTMAAMAVGMWLSALNVKYRDVKHVVPFLTRMGLYVTPVFFSISLIPQKWLMLAYTLNPMVGAVEGFRWCILGEQFEPYWPGMTASVAVVGLLLITGAYYFRTTEKTFADVI